MYDIISQVFNGQIEQGFNRSLAIDLFDTGRITERIIEGQNVSDRTESELKMRLGYMGHLTLIAEEVVKLTERHPPEYLSQSVVEQVLGKKWLDYVETVLAETRERDNAILGGVRPDINSGMRPGLIIVPGTDGTNGSGIGDGAGNGDGTGFAGSGGGGGMMGHSTRNIANGSSTIGMDPMDLNASADSDLHSSIMFKYDTINHGNDDDNATGGDGNRDGSQDNFAYSATAAGSLLSGFTDSSDGEDEEMDDAAEGEKNNNGNSNNNSHKNDNSNNNNSNVTAVSSAPLAATHAVPTTFLQVANEHDQVGELSFDDIEMDY